MAHGKLISGEGGNFEFGRFSIPKRRILKPQDLEDWMSSKAYADLVDFLTSLNKTVRGTDCSERHEKPLNINRILSLLREAKSWFIIPEINVKSRRYGSSEFKKWHAQLRENCRRIHQEILPDNMSSAYIELEPHLLSSFGNYVRLDYGTGNELSFVCWLLCLKKLNCLDESDYKYIILDVFVEYKHLVCEILSVYGLEPAGSKGAWGLDDYHFLQYYWGSMQLLGSKFDTKSTLSFVTIAAYANEYIYFDALNNQIQTLNKPTHGFKRVPKITNNVVLRSIYNCSNWEVANAEFYALYKKTVLHQFPALQHLVFGNIFSFEKAVVQKL